MVQSKRGTSNLSLSTGVEGVWGSGWVWSSTWIVRLQCNDNICIPTCISACGDMWQVRYKGAPNVCLKCGDPSHLSNNCRATRRRGEKVIPRWDENMGQFSEVFFPTKRLESMTEEDFGKTQQENILKGKRVGTPK